MIVRNIGQEEVQQRFYTAHGGGIATMLLDSSELQGMLFFAWAMLKPGKVLEAHIDPYEEIYYLLQGEGTMTVGDEQRKVSAGDAIWLPHSIPHSLVNDGEENCMIVVAAAMPH